MKSVHTVSLAAVMATTFYLSAGDRPTAIGWRGDGYSGVMPADCKPPKDFDGTTGRNLRWKAPLPNHGNSCPVAVGKKVFVTCADGWPVGQDCPQLLCFDADTGKELWRRNIDHFDSLPEAEAKAARADRAEFWKQHHETCTLLWELKHANPDEARQTAILGRLKELGTEGTVEHLTKKLSAHQGYFAQPELMKRLKNVGFPFPSGWGMRCMGVAMPSTASDGKAVYVVTGYRTISAFALDGKKLWQVVQTEKIPAEGAFFEEQYAHSPFLVEGKLLMHWYNHLWCFDPASGQVLWKTYTKPIPAHSMGQPTVLRPEAGGKSVTCIFTTWGQLIRLSDGKLLIDKIGWFGGNAIMSGDGMDVVWGRNGAEGGKPKEDRLYYDPKLKGMFGVRFRLDAAGEKATSELVAMPFNDAEMGWGIYPIFHQGRISCINGQIVSWDGKRPRVERNSKRHFSLGSNGSILADGRLYGQHDDLNKDEMMKRKAVNGTRNCYVRWMWAQDGRAVRWFDNPVEAMPAPLDMPAEQQRKIMVQVGDASVGPHTGIYGWHNSYKTPFAAGDRLYVRTYDYLYCFAPEVNGTPKDDPAKVAKIRQETNAEALAPALASSSAQERFEAIKRLGALKTSLPAPIAESLSKLLATDPHHEIRLAAMQTLDACDPAGKAGWTALGTMVLPSLYPEKHQLYEAKAKERNSLTFMLDDLDAAGVTALLKRWPDSDPVQRWFLLEMASTLAWKDAQMLKSVVALAQEKPDHWTKRNLHYAMPAYFAAVDAAADPAIADILLKVYANDESLSMNDAFRKNLPQEKYLAWLEGIAVGLKDFNARQNVLKAWRAVGSPAKASLQKISAALAAGGPNLLGGDARKQAEFRAEIENIIAGLEQE